MLRRGLVSERSFHTLLSDAVISFDIHAIITYLLIVNHVCMDGNCVCEHASLHTLPDAEIHAFVKFSSDVPRLLIVPEVVVVGVVVVYFANREPCMSW